LLVWLLIISFIVNAVLSQQITEIRNITQVQNIHSVRFSPDGKYLALTPYGQGVRVFNATSYNLVGSNNNDLGEGYAMTFTRDSTKVVYNTWTDPARAATIYNFLANTHTTLGGTVVRGAIDL